MLDRNRRNTRQNSRYLVGILSDLHVEPGESPSTTALSSFMEWEIMEDEGCVAHAPLNDMIQQIAPGDGMGHGSENKENSEDSVDETAVDGDDSGSSMICEEMLHYLERVGEFVAGRDNREGLATWTGFQILYPMGT